MFEKSDRNTPAVESQLVSMEITWRLNIGSSIVTGTRLMVQDSTRYRHLHNMFPRMQKIYSHPPVHLSSGRVRRYVCAETYQSSPLLMVFILEVVAQGEE
ncbi:hypothetical protein KCU92_g39, partial [Aureobasidium melanogenum]